MCRNDTNTKSRKNKQLFEKIILNYGEDNIQSKRTP